MYKDKNGQFLISQSGLDLVKHFEGLYHKAYLDPVGVYTIAYGRIRYNDESRVQPGDTCTEEQAEQWLLEDLYKDGAKFVRYYLNDKQEKELNESQFSALVGFTFNRGAARFRDYIAPFINKNDLNGAMKSLVSVNWAISNGKQKYLLGLDRRRWAERYLFEGKNWRDFDTTTKFNRFKNNGYK